MKILVINADCLTRNSSANLCHLAYIKGLVDLNYEVTLLSADDSEYEIDESMMIPEEVNCHFVNGVSLYEKMSLRKKQNSSNEVKKVITQPVVTPKINCISKIKNLIRSLYGVHGIYATFVRKAKSFRSDEEFDYVLSISTPPASHLLAYKLIKNGKVKTKQWIQIWEDPWYSDAYGFNGDMRIHDEEQRLLSYAEHICYVSPLTLKNQQKIYPESAHKMYWQPLPYYYKNEDKLDTNPNQNMYGYFGAYYPITRNLLPFYEAAKEKKIEVNICGDPCNLFTSTDMIHIHPRLLLAELKPIEDNTNVLVFLCNRQGGQIPGKIYQYSATNKIILFILDGTEEEQKVLREYFEPFNRYVFCNNTKEDITRAIQLIESSNFGKIKNEPLEDFNPKETIRKILDV